VNALFAAAAEIQAFCSARGWRSAIIGGLAVQRWGEPRQTRDVDLTLLSGLGGEERFVDGLLSSYRARIGDARAFAIAHRVVLIESASGVPLDVALGGLPFEARVVQRASPFVPQTGVSLITCSAEDLVVLKAFASRPQDWLDVEGILVRQGRVLDRTLILSELNPLLELKDDRNGTDRLGELFLKHPGT
jgi:hypothetical protein